MTAFLNPSPKTLQTRSRRDAADGKEVEIEVENKRITLDAFRTMPDIVDPMPVAHLLGISDRSVYRLCQNGTFKAVKCGKLWRINRDSVLSYIGVN